ncbi:hypothetical protein [Massilia endophytica]|uniref:hypothetical protein n=1 Tax=Massilia endophytica TaxID=2899220 RepID=UPI001E46EE51|nr:hypothetical protein [Massilia endophytica]UGQ48706.1 hypothetical protein LSQ66_09665 [Massilia endophytica]
MESYDESTHQAAGPYSGLSPRVLWVIGIAIAGFLVWAGMHVARSIATSRQIERVERVVARQGPPAVKPPAAQSAAPAAAAAPAPSAHAPAKTPPAAAPPAATVPPLAVALAGAQPPAKDAVPAEATAASKPAAAYDSSGWSGDDADIAESSGGSVDAESGADMESRPERRRATPAVQRREAPAAATESYNSNLFSRCPRPGVPGAVECRRAVCAGAARRAPSCKYYQDGQMD